MPRKRRTWVPGAGAHTISRFVDRKFHLVDEIDRHAYLECIDMADERWDWGWLCYALMSTHIHTGHIAGCVPPERFFQSAHTRFAHGYHARAPDQILGPVFAQRPAIHVVGEGEGALARLVAYQHRNPVEAGVVERASDSRWTSHRAYLRLDAAPTWLDVEWALSILGFRDTEAGRRHFDEFVAEVDLRGWVTNRPMLPRRVIAATSELPDCEWERLISTARDVARLAHDVSLASKTPAAVLARKLVGTVATQELAQPHACVAAWIDVHIGSVCNLVKRSDARHGFEDHLAEFRRRLAAVRTASE